MPVYHLMNANCLLEGEIKNLRACNVARKCRLVYKKLFQPTITKSEHFSIAMSRFCFVWFCFVVEWNSLREIFFIHKKLIWVPHFIERLDWWTIAFCLEALRRSLRDDGSCRLQNLLKKWENFRWISVGRRNSDNWKRVITATNQ